MFDKMYVCITARKEVPDREAGRAIYEIVKQKLADRPDVQVTGLVSNHFIEDPEP